MILGYNILQIVVEYPIAHCFIVSLGWVSSNDGGGFAFVCMSLS